MNPRPRVALIWDSMVLLGRFLPDCNTAFCTYVQFQYSELLAGGKPYGGTYTGHGIWNNILHIDTGGVQYFWGPDTITYSYIDINGCKGTASDHVNIDICEDIQDVALNHLLNIYPNPASKQIFIRIENITSQSIAIYDADGRMIYTMPFKAEIDISQLSSGVYFVEVKSNEGTARKRFVKM